MPCYRGAISTADVSRFACEARYAVCELRTSQRAGLDAEHGAHSAVAVLNLYLLCTSHPVVVYKEAIQHATQLTNVCKSSLSQNPKKMKFYIIAGGDYNVQLPFQPGSTPGSLGE